MSKENEVFTDYNVTLSAANRITNRFIRMLRDMGDDLEEDLEEEIVVCSLMKYYNLCSVSVKDEGGMDMGVDGALLWAIERVLQDFMSTSDFNDWMPYVKDKQNGR